MSVCVCVRVRMHVAVGMHTGMCTRFHRRSSGLCLCAMRLLGQQHIPGGTGLLEAQGVALGRDPTPGGTPRLQVSTYLQGERRSICEALRKSTQGLGSPGARVSLASPAHSLTCKASSLRGHRRGLRNEPQRLAGFAVLTGAS